MDGWFGDTIPGRLWAVYCVGALLGQPAEEEGEFRRHFWAAYEALRRCLRLKGCHTCDDVVVLVGAHVREELCARVCICVSGLVFRFVILWRRG